MTEPRRLSVEELNQWHKDNGLRVWHVMAHIKAIEAELAEANRHADFSDRNREQATNTLCSMSDILDQMTIARDTLKDRIESVYRPTLELTTKERDQALSRISVLEEALRFYAAKDNWLNIGMLDDYGQKARKALGEKR